MPGTNNEGSVSTICDVAELFEKKYEFTSEWPVPKTAFVSKKWSVPELQSKKEALNKVKEQLNNYPLDDWSKYTRFRSASGMLLANFKMNFQIELITQAWCKFYECLCQFPLIPDEAVTKGFLSSFHLCEAPGGFIAALNHYLASTHPDLKWEWSGNSLNPYYEGTSLNVMIPDDRLVRYTRDKWLFGADNTGDITLHYNYEHIVNCFKDKVWLVTADGSVDCMSNPGEQESIVKYLHYCEIMTALRLLHTGGNFVLKIFTMFEESTICHLYLLNCVFNKVNIFKPSSSKSGNSEVYVICLQYKGMDTLGTIWDTLMLPYKSTEFVDELAMFSLNQVGNKFIDQIISCAEFFKVKQTDTIEENVQFFRKYCAYDSEMVRCRKNCFTKYFIARYQIRSIPRNRRLHQEHTLNSFSITYRKQHKGYLDWPFAAFSSACCKSEHLDSLLQIQLGKCIEYVKHSNFAIGNNLNVNSVLPDNSILETVFQHVKENPIIFNIANYVSIDKQYEFEKKLLLDLIQTNIEDDIVFIKIPFVTIYLVGILFILACGYERIFFHKSGFITLRNSLPEKTSAVANCFKLVSDTYDNLPDNPNFKVDILEIVPQQCLPYSFADKIWYYNNIVYSSNR